MDLAIVWLFFQKILDFPFAIFTLRVNSYRNGGISIVDEDVQLSLLLILDLLEEALHILRVGVIAVDGHAFAASGGYLQMSPY